MKLHIEGYGDSVASNSDYFLTSKRLGFRTWSVDDLDLAVGLWGDFEVTKYFDGRGPLSREQVNDKLLKEIATQSAHGIQYWPIFLLKSGEHIGCAGLRPCDPAEHIQEIGFHIRSSHWRKGYASEAARTVMGYAFGCLKIKALFAGHNPENRGSRNLLTKLGFNYTHDAFYEPTGMVHPSYLLKAEEYDADSIMMSVWKSNQQSTWGVCRQNLPIHGSCRNLSSEMTIFVILALLISFPYS